MKISEACKICKEDLQVITEGEFATVKLIGIDNAFADKPAITFLGDKRFIDEFFKEKIENVICTEEIKNIIEDKYNGGIAVSQNPRTSFFEVHNYMAAQNKNEKQKNAIDKTAQIHPSAIIEEGNVTIGANTVISAGSIIKSGTKIGDECVIREGVIIGTPGFYYYGEGKNKKLVISAGGVRIGNNVELHPQTVIEKGVLYGDTIIGDNTKIDNLTLIGHDSHIGRDCLIAAGTTFAGGVEFGNRAFAGVGVAIAPYVSIGADAKLSSGAVATKNVAVGEHVSGNFAVRHDKFIQHIKYISGGGYSR